MTKSYTIFSIAYRIILGLFIVIFTLKSVIFPETDPNADHAGWWALLFSVVTLFAISAFQRLSDVNPYKIFLQLLVCALVLLNISFILFLFFTGEDSNLLVRVVMAIIIFVSAGLLFYLIQDKKYRGKG